MDHLAKLGALIRQREVIDNEIAALIGRPAQLGHVGEYIAGAIFDIELEGSASHKGSDGHFRNGPLAGSTVNIKWYTKHDGLLDVNPNAHPDYYLVLTGPKTGAMSSKGTVRPWVIASVYLFDARELIDALAGKKIGIATGVRQHLWQQAEIYPEQRNERLILSPEQRVLLAHFAPLQSRLG